MKQITFETTKAKCKLFKFDSDEILPNKIIISAANYLVGIYDNYSKRRILDDDSLDGKYQILGFLTDLTEEQKESVVDSFELFGNLNVGYKNYAAEEPVCDTSSESFESLLKSLNVFTENPLGENQPEYFTSENTATNNFTWFDYVYEWQTAQENVGNWLLLVEYL